MDLKTNYAHSSKMARTEIWGRISRISRVKYARTPLLRKSTERGRPKTSEKIKFSIHDNNG